MQPVRPSGNAGGTGSRVGGHRTSPAEQVDPAPAPAEQAPPTQVALPYRNGWVGMRQRDKSKWKKRWCDLTIRAKKENRLMLRRAILKDGKFRLLDKLNVAVAEIALAGASVQYPPKNFEGTWDRPEKVIPAGEKKGFIFHSDDRFALAGWILDITASCTNAPSFASQVSTVTEDSPAPIPAAMLPSTAFIEQRSTARDSVWRRTLELGPADARGMVDILGDLSVQPEIDLSALPHQQNNAQTDLLLQEVFARLQGKPLRLIVSLNLSYVAFQVLTGSRLIVLLPHMRALNTLILRHTVWAGGQLEQALNALHTETLAYIDLSGTDVGHFSAAQWEWLRRAKQLQRLELANVGIDLPALTAILLPSLPASLLSLNLQGNKLVTLPPGIAARLPELQLLDLSCTQLEFLPTTLKHAHCHYLLQGNPHLVSPPPLIYAQGADRIRTWLAKEAEEIVPTPKVKLLVLGHAGAGKTSLLHSLQQLITKDDNREREEDPDPFSANALAKAIVGWVIPKRQAIDNTSTIGVDPFSLLLEPKIKFSVWDFAGQSEYLTVHQFFFSPRSALYVLVTDMSASIEVQTSRLEHWLSLMRARLPLHSKLFTLLLCATKVDLVTNPPVLKERKAALEAFMRKQPFAVVPEALLISNMTQKGVSDLHKAIKTAARELVSLEELARAPRFFSQVQAFLAKHATNNILLRVDSVKSMFHSAAGSEWGPEMWRRCLSYLHDIGEVLVSSDFICVQPTLVSRAMALFVASAPHLYRLVNVREAATATYLGASGQALLSTDVVMARLRSLPELDRLTDDERTHFLQFMQQLDFCFPIKGAEQEVYGYGGWMFPSLRPTGDVFLPTLPAEAASQERWLSVAFSHSDSAVLSEIFFRLQVRLRSYHDSNFKLFHNGTLLRTEYARGLLRLHERRVVVIAAGAAPRRLLSNVLSTLEALVSDATALKVTALCPRCAQSNRWTEVTSEGACRTGHKGLPFEVLTTGAPYDAQMQHSSYLWAPSSGVDFTAAVGWQQRGPLRWTTLLPTESIPARRKEFEHAKALFYRFVARDQVTSFDLEKVIFLENSTLEKSFTAEFASLMHASLAVRTAQGLNTPADRSKQRWRDWIMSTFEHYTERVSGNEMVNLVAGWHGTTEEACWEIATSNFRDPAVQIDQSKKKDPGYFGNGIYFTQFPSYSAKYAKLSKCLLLSWLLMGRVYPVTEFPTDPENLLGKACQHSYNSHYALVRQYTDTVYLPAKPGERADYDELVVFRQSQVLPRYMFFYKAVDAISLAPDTCITVWLELAPSFVVSRMLEAASLSNPGVRAFILGSLPELIIWLSNHRSSLAGHPIRFVLAMGEAMVNPFKEAIRQVAMTAPPLLLLYGAHFTQINLDKEGQTVFTTTDLMRAGEFAMYIWPADTARRK